MSEKSEENMEKYKKLIDFFNKYKTMPKENRSIILEGEINSFLSDAGTIKDIILNPQIHPFGKELKETYVKNLELLYTISCKEHRYSARDKIFNFLNDGEFYKNIDSIFLKNAFIEHFKNIRDFDSNMAKLLFKVLENLSVDNLKKIKHIKSAEDLKSESEREAVLLQYRLFKIFVFYGNRIYTPQLNHLSFVRSMVKDILSNESNGTLAAQMFAKEYMDMLGMLTLSVVSNIITEMEKEELLRFLDSNDNIFEILNYILDNKLPFELGCYFISHETLGNLVEIAESKNLEAAFRMFALKTIAQQYVFPEKILARYIQDVNVKSKASADKEYSLLDKETIQELLSALSKSPVYNQDFSSKRKYANNIRIELKWIETLLKASLELEGIDVFRSLQDMPIVVSLDSDKDIQLLEDSFGGNSILLHDMNMSKERSIEKLASIIPRLIRYKKGATAAQTI
jgi:hypothetical protein